MSPLERSDLDDALARSGDGVFAIGGDGRIVLWNRSAERILGYTPRETLGKTCCDIFGGRDDRGNRLCFQGCHVQTLVKMGEAVQNFDMRTRTKTGHPVWINVSVLALHVNGANGATNGAGNSAVMIHLMRDVTATKELLTLVHEKIAAASGQETVLPANALTRRELEVLRLLAAGASTKGMAEKLHVSPATVRNHVQNIAGKLGVHSRLEAVAYATKHRLL